jgi:asparagine synthase (glutamine-hydrolysing)
MSGIVGVFHRDGRPVERSLVERMAQAMGHRARDGIFVWSEGAVGLGFLKTGATPESQREVQPVRDASGRYTLVFDGRIDNRQEVLDSLEPKARHLITAPDSALALYAYEVWGEALPARLVGDFAFAIWDKVERRLFCARDFLGMRPFFHYLDQRIFVFGTEFHPFFLAQAVPREVNEGMVGEFLAAALTNRQETLWRGVNRLLPACWLRVETSRTQQHQYWQPPDCLRSFRSDTECAERFRDLLFNAVRASLRAPSKVAAELSGGLDSSSVVVVASVLAADGLPTVEPYSVVFPELRGCDERQYISAVALAIGHDSIQLAFRPSGLEPSAQWARLFLDIPASANAIAHYPLLALMRERGHRVVLDGNGGDLWLTGSWYQYGERLGQGDLAGFAHLFLQDDGSLADRVVRLARYGVAPLLPRWLRRPLRHLLSRSLDRWPPPVPDWVQPQFARRIELAERLRVRPRPRHFSSSAQEYVFTQAAAAWQEWSNEFGERAGAFHGLEARSPLNDRPLVEFALTLADRHRWTPPWSKTVLRQALTDRLPPLVLERRDKGEFSEVFALEYSLPVYADLLRDPVIERAGWVPAGSAGRQLETFLARYRSSDAGYRRLDWSVYALVALEVWARETLK